MHGGIVMTEGQEGAEIPLNKPKRDDTEINRGVELLLRNKTKRRRIVKPHTLFQIKFSLFNREVTFYLGIKKKESLEE